jgi:lipopolysaccharide transport system ATP-binding protein
VTAVPLNKGDKFVVSLTVKNIAMRVGQFFIVAGVADESGLLWYETRYSKSVQIQANKGVGPLTMKADWQIEKQGR